MGHSSSSSDDPWAPEGAGQGQPAPSSASTGAAGEGGRGSGTGGPPPRGRPRSPAAPAGERSGPPADVVLSLQPPAVQGEIVLQAEAEAARAAGLPVPVLPTDEPAEAVLKKRIAEAHLKLDGAHEAALRVLADVAEGKVTQQQLGRDGTVHELPVEAKTRVSAARALLDHAAKITRNGAINVENANILSVGDLITRIDPDKLRAAVERRKAAGA